MTLVTGADGGGQRCFSVAAQDVVVKGVRAIQFDARPQIPEEQREILKIHDAVFLIDAPGVANIEVLDSEFHAVGKGIEIGVEKRGHSDKGFPKPSTDFAKVADCMFRGYYTGAYRLHDVSIYALAGFQTIGCLNTNSKNTIVERCDFAGADRRGGIGLNRCFQARNTSIRHRYVAHNNCHNVGPRASIPGMDLNMGKQILFHLKYPYGALRCH